MVFKIPVRKRLDADVRCPCQRTVADPCTCNRRCATISLPFCERDIWDIHNGIALIAAMLGLISPATLGMGSTWFSEPVSRFYLALFLFTLLKTLNCKSDAPRLARIGYPLLSGFALGYAFNTRPLSAIVFGVVGGGLTVYYLFTQRQQWQALLGTIKRFGFFFIPFVVLLGICMAWNAHFTGGPVHVHAHGCAAL